MKINRSLRSAFAWSLTLIAVLSVCMVGSFWIYEEVSDFNTNLRQIRQEYIATQKKILKEEVDRVIDYIDYKRTSTEEELMENLEEQVHRAVALSARLFLEYKGRFSPEEIQEMIKEALRSQRFNNDRGYYFIYDMQGNNVLLPHSPALEGKNLWNLMDSQGRFTIQRVVRLIREKGEGFLRWHWYKPGEFDMMAEKIGYHMQFKPYDWYIGTGEYIADFEEDIKKETLDRVNTIRFGDDGYIFVYDYDGNTLAHHDQKKLGVNRWDYQDPSGQYVLRNLMKIGREEDGGYLEYQGSIQPSTGLPGVKMGYARAVKDWQWLVGAGVYVESINAITAAKRQQLKKEIIANILSIVTFVLISLLIIGLISRYLSRKTTANIRIFTRFFEKATSDSIRISDDTVHFSEFKDLAQAANQMIEERNRVAASLESLQEQLLRSRKMEALGMMAGGVAHDLNNVLSAMVGYPDLILNELPADSPLKKYVCNIKNSGEKAAFIVQDLLTLAQQGISERQPLNLNMIIDEYLHSPEHNKLMRDNPRVRMETQLAPNLMNIMGSRVHLQKSIVNLVANAAEAQPDGGTVSIVTENRYLDTDFESAQNIQEGEYVCLTVEDEGIGITEDDLLHIFEPFYTKKVMGKGGTGLGMAVVWGTVQDHEGSINVSTEQEKGSTFELYFPASRESILDAAASNDVIHYGGYGETILVVDDLEEQRELAQAMLASLGYAVETVASGEEALEYLRDRKVDLLLLDMVMDPGMDGLETYRRVLRLKPRQKTIIVSGYAETGKIKAVLSLGVGQYVKKPYNIGTLGKAVKKELHR